MLKLSQNRRRMGLVDAPVHILLKKVRYKNSFNTTVISFIHAAIPNTKNKNWILKVQRFPTILGAYGNSMSILEIMKLEL